MPKLREFRKTKTVELPNFPGSKVVMYTSLLVKDERELDDMQLWQTQRILEALRRLIADWNFYEDDEETQKSPITVENIEKFWQDDIKAMVEALDLSQEKKSNTQ